MTTSAERIERRESNERQERSQALLNDASLTSQQSTEVCRCMKPADKLPDSFGNVLLFDGAKSGQTGAKVADGTAKNASAQLASFKLIDKNADGSVDWKELCFFEQSGPDGKLSAEELKGYLERTEPDSQRASVDHPAQPAPPVDHKPGERVAPPVGRAPDKHDAAPIAEAPERKSIARRDVSPVKDGADGAEPTKPGTNFTTKDGKIYGPDGRQFTAAGFAMYTHNALNDANVNQAIAMKPNIIRLAADPSKDSPQEIQKIIDKFTSRNIVVEVEDHRSGNKVEGEKLARVADWYGQIAKANVGNPLVWFGTPNEPNQETKNFVQTEKTVYDAIRNTGNKNIVMLEVDYNKTGVQPILDNPQVYGKMTNVVIDHHMYSSSPNAAEQLQWSLKKEGLSGMPVIVGEFGNATSPTKIEHYPSFNAIVDANRRGDVGAIAWAWENPGRPAQAELNAMFDPNGKLTAYGEKVKNWLAGEAQKRNDTPQSSATVGAPEAGSESSQQLQKNRPAPESKTAQGQDRVNLEPISAPYEIPQGRNAVPKLPGKLLVSDSIKDGSIAPFKRHLLDDSGGQGNMPDIQWVDVGNGDKAARFIQVKDPSDLRRNRRNSITDTSAAMRLNNDGSVYNYAFSTRLVEMPESTGHANLFAFHDAPADPAAWGAKVKDARLGGAIGLAVKNGYYTFFSGGNDDANHTNKVIWRAPYKEGEFVDWRIRVRAATEDDPKAWQDKAFTELYMNGKLVARATGWNQHGHDLSEQRNKMAKYSYMNAGVSAGFSWGVGNERADRRIVDIGYITASKEV